MAGLKEPVRLRVKRLKDGAQSLYLDIYSEGERSYEFLKLYLLPGDTPDIKKRNDETMKIANTIKARRVLELQTARAGMPLAREDAPLLAVIDSMMEAKAENTRRVYTGLRVNVAEYVGKRKATLKTIDRRWVEGFLKFLASKGLRPNSIRTYYNFLKACFNDAIERGYIQASPARGVKPPKSEASKRAYLTLDELQRMITTDCDGLNGTLRRAFLFSCLTGLRYSDVVALQASDVELLADGSGRVSISQKKTSEMVSFDIPSDAVGLVDLSGGACFKGMPHCAIVCRQLKRWADAAEVGKHVTFHVARHTFATLMLTQGVDIFTVSKLLGHTSVATTQIYAKVIDETKREAMSRLAAAVHVGGRSESLSGNKSDSESHKNEAENER